MKWSVALFGHEKPTHYIRDIKTGLNVHQWIGDPGDPPKGMKIHVCTGVEKRAIPGDIIAARPDKCWSCDAAQHKNIVSMIKNPKYLATRKKEMLDKYLASCAGEDSWRPKARFERIWGERVLKYGLHDPQLLPDEVAHYFSFLPGASMWHLNGRDVWGGQERKLFLIADLDGIESGQLAAALEPVYDTTVWPENESVPVNYTSKRRMNIPLETLSGCGVEVEKMLDPNISYCPGAEITKPLVFDKLKNTQLSPEAKLNPIQREENYAVL